MSLHTYTRGETLRRIVMSQNFYNLYDLNTLIWTSSMNTLDSGKWSGLIHLYPREHTPCMPRARSCSLEPLCVLTGGKGSCPGPWWLLLEAAPPDGLARGASFCYVGSGSPLLLPCLLYIQGGSFTCAMARPLCSSVTRQCPRRLQGRFPGV